MDFIETVNGNRIAKSSRITGSEYILIAGNSTVCGSVELSGENPARKPVIQIGRFCYLGERVCVGLNARHDACKLGSFVSVGAGTRIVSASISNRVVIGADCVIGEGCTIHEVAVIRQGVVLPARYVVPPFSVVWSDGRALRVGKLPESFKKLIELACKKSYINNNCLLCDCADCPAVQADCLTQLA